MAEEWQEVVAVLKDASGCSMEEVNLKGHRWRLGTRKATEGRAQATADSGKRAWRGKARVEDAGFIQLEGH